MVQYLCNLFLALNFNIVNDGWLLDFTRNYDWFNIVNDGGRLSCDCYWINLVYNSSRLSYYCDGLGGLNIDIVIYCR